MIRKDNKGFISMYIGGQEILSVYTQRQLVWPEQIINKVLSCYFNGYWEDDNPWTDETYWVD